MELLFEIFSFIVLVLFLIVILAILIIAMYIIIYQLAAPFFKRAGDVKFKTPPLPPKKK